MELDFLNLLRTALPNVSVIFWDLDGTLGEQPGWSGVGSVFDYIQNPIFVQRLIQTLASEGYYNVLVSRNGMFCGDNYAKVLQDFETLGFAEVFSCYRNRNHSKVYGFTNLGSVLLIDDQWKECIEACQDGAYALHIDDIFQRALPTRKFAILYPKISNSVSLINN